MPGPVATCAGAPHAIAQPHSHLLPLISCFGQHTQHTHSTRGGQGATPCCVANVPACCGCAACHCGADCAAASTVGSATPVPQQQWIGWIATAARWPQRHIRYCSWSSRATAGDSRTAHRHFCCTALLIGCHRVNDIIPPRWRHRSTSRTGGRAVWRSSGVLAGQAHSTGSAHSTPDRQPPACLGAAGAAREAAPLVAAVRRHRRPSARL
jgi:hypothetical protein